MVSGAGKFCILLCTCLLSLIPTASLWIITAQRGCFTQTSNRDSSRSPIPLCRSVRSCAWVSRLRKSERVLLAMGDGDGNKGSAGVSGGDENPSADSKDGAVWAVEGNYQSTLRRRKGIISAIVGVITAVAKFFRQLLFALFLSKFSLVRGFFRGIRADWLLAQRAWKQEMRGADVEVEMERRNRMMKQLFEEDDRDVVDKLDSAADLLSDTPRSPPGSRLQKIKDKKRAAQASQPARKSKKQNMQKGGRSTEGWARGTPTDTGASERDEGVSEDLLERKILRDLGMGEWLTDDEEKEFAKQVEDEMHDVSNSQEDKEKQEVTDIMERIDRINKEAHRKDWETLAKLGGRQAIEKFRRDMRVETEGPDADMWADPEWLLKEEEKQRRWKQETEEAERKKEEEAKAASIKELEDVELLDKQDKGRETTATVAEPKQDGGAQVLLEERQDLDDKEVGRMVKKEEVVGGETWLEKSVGKFVRAVTGRVPLIEAVEDGSIDAVKYLLSKGADVDEEGPDGKNAFQVAIELGDEKLVQLLVLARQRRKPKFLSIDEVASKSATDPEEVIMKASRGRRRGEVRRRGFKAEQWRAVLTQEAFECLRLAQTEAPFSSQLYNETRAGVYSCAGCGTAVFHSAFKFDGGEGFPNFFNAIASGIQIGRDGKGIKVRREVLCSCCGSHLGFVWADGWIFDGCPVDTRFVINGAGLNFAPDQDR